MKMKEFHQQQSEKYQFDSERNVYKYIGNSNGLFVYNVIGDGYLGKLTNLVRD